MSCFCTVPADAARNRFNVGIPILPPPPLALRMTAAIPALLPGSRLDLQIATGLQQMNIPNISFGGAGLMQFSMMASLAVGTFALDDIPTLEMQMETAAVSIARNVWPRLGWLTSLKMQPLLNYAIVAQLVLDLQALGLDPFTMHAPPPAPMIPSTRFALSMPQLKMARLMAGLPTLVSMMETFQLPPLGDLGAVPAMNNFLMPLAQLTPPSLVIPLPMLTKLALVLESLAKIDAAFGDPFSPTTWQKIDSMMRMWSSFPLTLPLPALALAEKLALLPMMEDINFGGEIARQAAPVLSTPFSMPKLAIGQFLNMSLALSASLQLVAEMPAFDQCSMCPCA